MPATKLPRASRDSPIRASDYNQVVEAAERADGLEVDESSGLQLVAGASGKRLSLNLPDAVGFGYTTAAASTSGNVATAGTLKVCAWVQTSSTTFTFTDLGYDPQPCITPDSVTMPASKRVWWRRDNASGVLVIDGALCPLTTTDPAPATPPVTMVSATGQTMQSATGTTMTTA